MRPALRVLCMHAERVQRDIERQLERASFVARERLNDLLGRAQRILLQRPTDKSKLYALHASEVECISKGKVSGPVRVRRQSVDYDNVVWPRTRNSARI
jgi:transposase, IS5 family